MPWSWRSLADHKLCLSESDCAQASIANRGCKIIVMLCVSTLQPLPLPEYRCLHQEKWNTRRRYHHKLEIQCVIWGSHSELEKSLMEIPHSVVIGVTNLNSPVKCSYNLLAPGFDLTYI